MVKFLIIFRVPYNLRDDDDGDNPCDEILYRPHHDTFKTFIITIQVSTLNDHPSKHVNSPHYRCSLTPFGWDSNALMLSI